MAPASLHFQLESELPQKLAVGKGTALFVCGWCFSSQGRIRSLSLGVDDERQPVMASRMPRLDPFQAFHPTLDAFANKSLEVDPDSSEDPLLQSYRSGFWGIARIAAPRAGVCVLTLLAELEDGSEASAELAQVQIDDNGAPIDAQWPGGQAPAVAICMATYNPPRDLLARQLESIRSQTHDNWICIISDDCSRPASYDALREATEGDPRFYVSRSPQRLGFYHNFERAMAMVPKAAEYVVLADQDDHWHPDKLETLVASLGGAQLVFSDARVVSRDGELISDTWWNQRRNNHTRLASLLVANAVTGAASLMRRDLLDYALPFPPAQFAHFHDHWIGLTALALGDIAYVDRPLYDYVQHGDASLGHANANVMTSLGHRLRHQRGARERARMWRLHYFADVCRLLQFATVLRMRCASDMTRANRRALDRFINTDHSVRGLSALALRGMSELVGTTETLGAEWMLAWAFAWRRLVSLSARDRPQARFRLDAVPPTSLIQQPGKSGPNEVVRAVADKIAPLNFSVSDDAPSRINLLIPTIDLQHFFGGYIAKLNLAKRLVDMGERVRIVTVDPVGPQPSGWRKTLESYSGLRGLFDRVEVAFGQESASIEVSRDDGFVATTWWTAHIAHQAMQGMRGDRFLYLIQEYEPFTFPMGTYAALANESYRFSHFALFSSELLRDYFRRHQIGVYSDGKATGDRHSEAFQNAITPIPPATPSRLAQRRTRRLLFYARPEPHAARNMFELGMLALSRAVADGVFTGDWELHGIGTVNRAKRLALGDGAALELVPRSDQSAYAALLQEHDVGLALMYTPHPSLVPIEMASAGMLTVTNSFENKTPEAMAAISSNIITTEPSVEGIASGLREAVEAASDYERRARGAAVNWSRDWDESLSDDILARVVATFNRVRAADR